MKSRRLTAALAATAAVAVVGGSTAAATGVFSGSDSTERAVRTALDDHHPKNVIFLLGDGMGTQEITAARYYQGVHKPLNVDRLPFTGFDTTWSVKPGASAALPARLRPRLGFDRHVLGDGPQDDRRAHLAGAEHRRSTCPARTTRPCSRSRSSAGKKVGNVSTAEITDATPAVLASHISLRGCQGPENMDDCPSGDEGRGRARLDRRAGGRPRGRRAARRRPRPLRPRRSRAVPTPARPWSSRPQGKGYRYVTDADGLAGVGAKQAGPRPLQRRATCRSSGPARPRRPARATPPVACTEGQRPANEPSLAAMTTKAIELLAEPQGLLPAGRGRLDRQAGPRRQRLRADRRDGRLRPGDRRRARLPAPTTRTR